MHIKYLFVVITLLFQNLRSTAQADTCGKNNTGPYWPVTPGDQKHYYTTSGSYVSTVSRDGFTFGDKNYFRIVEDYGNDAPGVRYQREEQGNVYIYDTIKNIEFLELSNNTTPGFTWEKYDGTWKYTVMDTTSKVSTPFCVYTQLLKIKAEPMGSKKKDYSKFYQLYYKRGIGLVGLDIENKGYKFLTVDPASVVVVDFHATGCEAENRSCTIEAISREISMKFAYRGKIKRGLMEIEVIVSELGKVTEARLRNEFRNADSQVNEVIRILENMTFSPRTINGKPAKTAAVIPVKF